MYNYLFFFFSCLDILWVWNLFINIYLAQFEKGIVFYWCLLLCYFLDLTGNSACSTWSSQGSLCNCNAFLHNLINYLMTLSKRRSAWKWFWLPNIIMDRRLTGKQDGLVETLKQTTPKRQMATKRELTAMSKVGTLEYSISWSNPRPISFVFPRKKNLILDRIIILFNLDLRIRTNNKLEQKA